MKTLFGFFFLTVLCLSGCFGQILLNKKATSFISLAGAIPQINYEDYNYYTVFEFGSPAQKVELIQDTWVGETWINIVNSTYNLSASKTANVSKQLTTYNYSYNVGTVTGYAGTETISIPAINLTNLRIPLLFEQNGTGRGTSYQGSIGLANFKEYKNWLQVAVSNGLLADSVFAFDLRNAATASYFYAGSASFPKGITYSELTWLSVLAEHWQIGNITGTVINGVTYSQDENAKEAVWDSGFAVTFIGPTAFNAFVKFPQIQNYCQYNAELYLYICTCNQTYPDFSLTTPKINFYALAQDYMFQLQGGYCVLGISTNPETWVPFMIFGEGMFRNYFVAYDKVNQKIGFSKNQAYEKKVQTINREFLSK